MRPWMREMGRDEGRAHCRVLILDIPSPVGSQPPGNLKVAVLPDDVK
jgi:hypothetical protein